jgi:uncharacterized repeat protein (TIGR03837 family)
MAAIVQNTGTLAPMQSRRWDIFCKVIDNHGDLGVCWRLACQLAARGESARLWVDDASALRWMAPEGRDGVQVVDWLDPAAVQAAAAAPAPDVLVEGFGCDPAPELIARFAEDTARAWINLEYLSAEPYVERLHGLPSPVFKGPGAGLTKRFFYPGFTPATGGLLREPDLMARREAFDRSAWLAARQIPWTGNERLVSLFCYEPPALAALLARLAEGPEPTSLLVTAGRAAQAVRTSLAGGGEDSSAHGALSISYLPYLTQADFDHLLWSCDLNFVRGRRLMGSRALGRRPVRLADLSPGRRRPPRQARRLARLAAGAPPSLRLFHHAWNGFGDAALPAPETAGPWRETVRDARARLLAQDDLVTQLAGSGRPKKLK